MGLFGDRKRRGSACGVCGAAMPSRRCKACDDHASSCGERFHYPGRCKIGEKERDFPGTVWDHRFEAGDVPPAELL